MYTEAYGNSWALVVGVNTYVHAPPLLYARSDAEAVATTLKERFGFIDERVTLLVDEDASREGIMRSYMAYSSDAVQPDDRLIVFFAGHGHTRTGRHGEVGFLVPVDGDPEDLLSLIRWDDLTRNAEFIPAKHVLFVMDACYGGLALQRAASPGAMRFIGDMLVRLSRQVLTAGKADETVADAGGPRPNHSIFTGHLLNALEGEAYSPEGILTANRLMAHVYQRVGQDPNSHQTPHYGFLEGDGDLVFNPPDHADETEKEGEADPDVLVPTQPDVEPPSDEEDAVLTPIDRVKQYLAEARFRIELDDLVGQQVRALVAATAPTEFPTDGHRDELIEEFARRLRRYEDAALPLQQTLILMGKWGDDTHRATLQNAFSRVPDGIAPGGGVTLWLGLRWYPVSLLMYSVGIASVASGRYDNLATALMAPVGNSRTGQGSSPLMTEVVQGMLEVTRTNAFKNLPGRERQYVPQSEYLFKVLQAPIEDLLFLGRGYEDVFDRFEVILALVYAYHHRGVHLWGPPGRFAYKLSRGYDRNDPYSEVLAEAKREGAGWGPLRAGLFDSSSERFVEIAEAYGEKISGLDWI